MEQMKNEAIMSHRNITLLKKLYTKKCNHSVHVTQPKKIIT